MIKVNRPICPNPSALSGGNYKHPDNKAALRNASFDKCVYCESKVSHVYYADVEHIKPKEKFPKLEFRWENLGFVCAKCNGIKKDKFDEKTPFINPYEDDPDEHVLFFGAFIKHKKGSERGEITIDESKGIGLNRNELLERRHEKIQSIGKTIDRCFRTTNQQLKENAFEELKKEADQVNEYSLCVKYLLQAHQVL